MRVRKIAGDCDHGTCPTIYVSDAGTIVVQGYSVDEADGLSLGDGERAVEIPERLLRSAMKGLVP